MNDATKDSFDFIEEKLFGTSRPEASSDTKNMESTIVIGEVFLDQLDAKAEQEEV